MITKKEQLKILNDIVFNYLKTRHSQYCQTADLEDLKQEVLMRLSKIMPETFESEKHFYNWCRKFCKMYSINAFRDYLTTLRHRPREILVGSIDEKIVEEASCSLFLQKQNLNERFNRLIEWKHEAEDIEMQMIKVLTSNNSAVTAVSKNLNLSISMAKSLLKGSGLRTKYIHQFKRND